MHCVAALSLDGFYVAALRSEVPVDDHPLVLTKDKLVLDASTSARTLGVAVGQTQAEARAILGKQGCFLEWSEGRFTKAAEQWLNVAAQFSETVEPLVEHRSLLDLSGHPDPLKTAEELKLAVEQTLPVSASVGIGSCRWIAEASCQKGTLEEEPLRTPRVFVRALSTLQLEPVEWRDRERLMSLGYRTIGEVAAIPYLTLSGLFGKRAVTIARAAQGGGDPRVKALYPKGSRGESLSFPSPPENWQQIEEASKRLAKRLGAALYREDLTAHDIELVATFEDGRRLSLKRSFTKPLISAKAIERALSLMIREPFDTPVERLLVRLKNLERSTRVQRSFEGFVQGTDRRTALNQTLKSLSATFGAGSVEQASAIPLARYQAVRKAWQEANGWTWR